MRETLKKISPVLLLIVGLVIGYVAAPSSPAPDAHSHDADSVWTCSMHPQVRQNEAGSCPICGMDLVPISDDDVDQDPTTVSLSPRARALAEVRTTKVKRLDRNSGSLRLIGRVEKNQNETRVITAWFGGRVDRLRVSSEGEIVRRGQTIADVYSPEIYAAHQDLLVARSQLDQLKNAEPFARRAVESALNASKTKLRLLGITDSEITKMMAAKKPWTKVPVRSPFAGTVIQKKVNEGQYVTSGAPLLEISDLSKLWVELDAYADDLPAIAIGDAVRFTVDAIPGQTFQGNVAFIEPTVDVSTRTATIRVVVENDGALKPGQYVNATVQSSQTEAPLVIPRTSPMYAGKRSLVYVQTNKPNEDPRYTVRTVSLGQTIGDHIVVNSGLREGEAVVSYGTFALDADLQIRDGASVMSLNSAVVPPEFSAMLEESITHYLAMQAALFDDNLTDAASAAQRMETSLGSVEFDESETWRPLEQALQRAARSVASAKTLTDARTQFQTASDTLVKILEAFGNPTNHALHLATCPMAFDNKGAAWVQVGTEIRNAYFGEEMPTCGSIEQSFVPSAAPQTEPATQSESQ